MASGMILTSASMHSTTFMTLTTSWLWLLQKVSGTCLVLKRVYSCQISQKCQIYQARQNRQNVQGYRERQATKVCEIFRNSFLSEFLFTAGVWRNSALLILYFIWIAHTYSHNFPSIVSYVHSKSWLHWTKTYLPLLRPFWIIADSSSTTEWSSPLLSRAMTKDHMV